MPSHQMQRDSLVLTSGTVAAQAIAVISTPLLGRLYSPAAYGVWSLLQSAAGIPVAVGGLRYELALNLAETDEEAINLGALGLVCLMFTIILTGVVGYIWTGGLASLLGIKEYQQWIVALPAIVFALAFINPANYWNIRERQFGALARFRVTQRLGVVVAQCAIWFVAQGPNGLVAGGILGLLSPCVIFLIELGRDYRGLFAAISLNRMWTAAKKYKNFPFFTVPAGFVSTLRDRGVYLLIGAYATTSAVGLYATAVRLAYAPVQLIASSLSPIVYRRACEYKTISSAAPMVYRVLSTISNFSTPTLVVVGWFAGDLFRVAMGKRWEQAGVFVAILAIPASLEMLSGPLERMLDMVNRQKVALVIEACYSAVGLAIATAFLALGKGVLLSVGLFSVSTCVYHVALIWAVYHYCGYPIRDFLKVLSRNLALGLGTAAVLFMISPVRPWN